VIRHAARGHESAALIAENTANVRVQSVEKLADEEWSTLLRTEEQMIM
jgi:hypothetical protein